MKRHFVKAIMAAMCFSAITSMALFTGCKDDDEVKIIHDTVTVINTNYDTIVNIKEGGNIFIVSYSSEYGTQPGSVIVRQDGKLAEKDLRPISADGHTFLGWFLDGKKVESGLSVSSDITLTAQWSDETYELFLDDKSAKLDDIYDLKSGRHTIKVTGTMTHILYSQIASALRENPDVQFDVDMGETEGLKVAADTYYDVYEYMGFGRDKYEVQNLLSIVLPKTVESIADYAFAGCKLLEKVSFPDGLIEIGKVSFRSTNLSEVNIPSSVKKMAEDAFTFCEKLKSLVLPDGTKSIRLELMSNLESIVIPNGVISVYIHGCDCLKSLEVPNSVKSLDLYGSYNLTSLTFPDDLSYFSMVGCNLQSITIPKCVTQIGSFPGWGVTFGKKTETIVLPETIVSIEPIFSGCDNLKTITLQGTNPPNFSSNYSYINSFDDFFPKGVTIKVPESALNTYKTAEHWSIFADQIVGY